MDTAQAGRTAAPVATQAVSGNRFMKGNKETGEGFYHATTEAGVQPKTQEDFGKEGKQINWQGFLHDKARQHHSARLNRDRRKRGGDTFGHHVAVRTLGTK